MIHYLILPAIGLLAIIALAAVALIWEACKAASEERRKNQEWARKFRKDDDGS